MLRKICYTIICLGKKFYLHRRFVGKKSYPNQSNPLQPTKSSGSRLRSAKLNYQPQSGETEPATRERERERKKSRLGQTQFDDFEKWLKYTWFSTYFYWQLSSLI